MDKQSHRTQDPITSHPAPVPGPEATDVTMRRRLAEHLVHLGALRHATDELLLHARAHNVVTPAHRRAADDHDRLVAVTRDSRAAARTATRAYGAYLRATGIRPEHLVPPIRHVVVHLCGATTTPRSDESLALVRAVVRWGIQGYYGTIRTPTTRWNGMAH
jgi:hypothetical protein